MSAMLREAEHDTDVRLVVINFFSFNDDRTINVRDFRDGSDLEDVLSLYGLFMMFEESKYSKLRRIYFFSIETIKKIHNN